MMRCEHRPGTHNVDVEDDNEHKRRLFVPQLMALCRVVWEHVIMTPWFLLEDDWSFELRALSVRECCWLMGVAEALFPLVPLACRVVATTTLADDDGPGVTPEATHSIIKTSRYFGLECAGVAGSQKCAEWIVKAHRGGSRDSNYIENKKECLTVLRGLCLGGHIGLAQKFVDGTNSVFPSLRWPVNDPDMQDDLREMAGAKSQSLLHAACTGGNLEVVKWVMSRFGVGKAGWELVQPFEAAVRRGHLDVVKWLASSTGAVDACKSDLVQKQYRGQIDPQALSSLLASPNLEVVKLCMELFGVPEKGKGQVLTRIIQCFPWNGREFDEECCAWVKETLAVEPADHPPLGSLPNSESLRWVINSFSLQPRMWDLCNACKVAEDDDLISWLLKSFPRSIGGVTGVTLCDACRNRKDSVPVVKAVLSKLREPPNERLKHMCLEFSLASNNTHIAEWLENTFHVMDNVNSDPKISSASFYGISTGNKNCKKGAKWFLSRVKRHNITGKRVLSAIGASLKTNIPLALLLLNEFNVCSLNKSQGYTIESLVEWANLSQAKQFLSHCNFSSDFVGFGLSLCWRVQSGKVVRWLIGQYHLTEEQVKRKHNHLLSTLIAHNKTGCAEWLIQEFHVTVTEFEQMAHSLVPVWKPGTKVSTWKMVLRVFPEITALRVFEAFALESPLHMEVTTRVSRTLSP
ncbi:hypothetical protein Pelo_3487 [Pelomyxa schiedti]|nr:hypothetical protein Pelo_3487 [Pelomyxa schiedti]